MHLQTDEINGIGREVNSNAIPETDEIFNNINFNRKLSGKNVNKNKSPFKPNNKRRIPNSANAIKDKISYEEKNNDSFMNPLEAFGLNTSNVGNNTSMNTTIMTTANGTNTTFINDIHNYMQLNNINIGSSGKNRNVKKKFIQIRN